jgi:hypothetical protein
MVELIPMALDEVQQGSGLWFLGLDKVASLLKRVLKA